MNTTRDFNAQQVYNGTFGEVWIDDNYLATLESFSAEVDIGMGDVVKPGNLWKHKKMLELEGTGEITIQSIDSTGKNIMAKKIKEGKMPVVKIMGKLADPDAKGVERIVFKDVTFNKLTLMDFEHGSIVKETLPFNFTDFDIYDLVD